MSPEPLIRVERVRKRYGRHSVLQVDELSILPGQRIVVTGPNGCGKSTLLRLLSRVVPPTRGRVRWSDTLSGATVGYVPQQGGLYEELTLQDNLDLRRNLYGKVAVDPDAQGYVHALGLAPLLQRRFSQLSGGFRRLAALAAALHVEPEWLILDEPLAGVGRKLAEAFLEELTARDSRLRTVIMASPTSNAYPQANRTIELEEGRVRCAEH